MHAQGAIFHHGKMPFKDGAVGRKFLVLLNSPQRNDPYVFVKTTSKEKEKPRTEGCIKERSLFFIPAGKMELFQKDTWIQLHETYLIDCNSIRSDRDIAMAGAFNSKTAKLIIDCLFHAEEDNLSPVVKNLLRIPIQSSLHNLQSLFNQKRC